MEAEAPILWLPDAKSWLIGKDPDAGKNWGGEKGATEDEMVGWHHWFNGREFEQTLGESEGEGRLVCCSSQGRKESDVPWDWTTTKWWKYRKIIYEANINKKMLVLLCLSKNGVFRVKNRYYILINIESHQKYFLPENTQ